MKVFAENIIENHGIDRIVTAVKKYAPTSVEFVDRERSADLVIIYAYGQRRKVAKRIKWIGERGQKYMMVQIAIRSTANPSTEDWLPLWKSALGVWSYYNLFELCEEDGQDHKFKFYHAPLGVDSELFQDLNKPRKWKCVVGDSRDESVSEVVRAAQGNVFHLGTGITDEILVEGYNSSEFVSGLRRKEGFEMPVLEGLLCGARPICYDQPHFRKWFGTMAEYTPEGHPEEVVASLEKIFEAGPEPVTQAEKDHVKYLFNWQTIITGFWAGVL